MGAGISAMHYIGMAALSMEPGITWNLTLVAASVTIAVGASAAALLIFFWLRAQNGPNQRMYQFAAALLMGLAISGMHYTAMAAADFPANAVCRSADALSGSGLSILIVLASTSLLALTLFTSILDARMQGKTSRLASSLKVANDQLQLANTELQRRAFLDPLTQLPNRILFEDRLAHAVLRCERAHGGPAAHEKLAVLFIDLDGFKPVNDSFGHATGDLVLKEAARRLLETARGSDTVARVGGDEFLLLMENLPGVSDCVALARRLLDVLDRPFELLNRQVRISGSIGIVVYPDHGQMDKLVARADAAMYAAKRAGGNSIAMFEEHMDGGALDQLSLQNDLRSAVAMNQLRLHYQPKVHARDDRLSGVEALLRWQHPTRGLVSPAEFIPIAERHGMICELGNWVIDEVCRQMGAWSQRGLCVRVSLNLSAYQLRQADLVERIGAALCRHGLAAAQLICEITESVAMGDLPATQRTLESLEVLGVPLSIDDFGTGYSSLSYLRRLRARELKIDRSFVKDLASSSDARAVVDAVIRLAHALGMQVVAEGVETKAQREILLGMACDELQGYLYARPLEADALLAWVLARTPARALAERGGAADQRDLAFKHDND
jgi:diguanylate cyclase (GGDEF)-like protein